MDKPISGSSEKAKNCIISFSEIKRDARVLRQIEYLLPNYHVTVIGLGEKPTIFNDCQNLHWIEIVRPGGKVLLRRIKYIIRIFNRSISRSLKGERESLIESAYWTNGLYRQAVEYPKLKKYDLIHANDWNSLPIAAEAARKTGARVVFDAHEYSPDQFGNQLLWKLTFAPAINHLLKKYSAQIDGFITVESGIGIRYKKEYGWDPTIIRNIPKMVSVSSSKSSDKMINLVHHGIATPDRKLETMIQTVALCDERFHLYLLLVDCIPGYIERLKFIANREAPNRVTFLDAVSPHEVVPSISKFDLGIYILDPVNYNYQRSLPNKLFDFIAAGLGVVIGPSPAMAGIVQEYGLGCVAPTFLPRDVALTLNEITASQIQIYKSAAVAATKTLNSDVEMEKLINLYRLILQADK